MPIHTDRTIAANWLDIELKNKIDRTCLLIDITIPLDTNTSVKTTKKLNKYKDLEIEIEQSRWLWEPLTPSRSTWKTTSTKSLATSTYMNSRNNSPFYSPPSQAGPLCQVETLSASQSP